MGGGESAAPTTPTGYIGGSAFDYTAPILTQSPPGMASQGYDWKKLIGGIAGGLEGIGQGLSNAGGSVPQFSVPDIGGAQIPEARDNVVLIPQSQQGNQQTELLNALMRLISGG